MNRDSLHIKSLLTLTFLIVGLNSYCQDTLTYSKFNLDSSLITTISLGRFQPSSYYLLHSPDKKDNSNYRKYKSLIGQAPTKKNHELYYSLACSLWELEKLQDAEKMFLTIIKSTDKFYESTYYHSSDIPGDTTTNIYGYGSFTSNYKNYAAIYLTKIYLEQKKFDNALQFLEDAVKKYKVTYSCGTGFHQQQDEYNFLYSACYLGLDRYNDVVDLIIPSCLNKSDTIIISAIRHLYTQQEIETKLDYAVESINCILDTFPSYAYQTTYSDHNKEKTDTLKYFSSSATMTLFDRKINLPTPSLNDGDYLTKEMFVKLFKESDFYYRLKNNN
jgi:tetratricopeptide (TPR) repeat protein